MKKFAAFLMILSVSVFAIGCGGKTESKSPEKTESKSPSAAPEGGHEDGKTKTDGTD